MKGVKPLSNVYPFAQGLQLWRNYSHHLVKTASSLEYLKEKLDHPGFGTSQLTGGMGDRCSFLTLKLDDVG